MNNSRLTITASKSLEPNKYTIKIEPTDNFMGNKLVFKLSAEICDYSIKYYGQVSLIDPTVKGQYADEILKEYYIYLTELNISDLERTLYSGASLIQHVLHNYNIVDKFTELYNSDTINNYEIKESHIIDENTITERILTYYNGMSIDIIASYALDRIYSDRVIDYEYTAVITKSDGTKEEYTVEAQQYNMTEKLVALFSKEDRIRHIREIFILPSIETHLNNEFNEEEN
jgi:hypothetical protein